MSVIAWVNSSQPSWTCYIDGNLLVPENITNSPSNDVEICTLPNITKTTPSNLTVTAVDILLDYIQYAPVASTIIHDATWLVDAFDSQIQYDSEWNKSGSQAETLVQGASMTFDFVGTLIHSFIFIL